MAADRERAWMVADLEWERVAENPRHIKFVEDLGCTRVAANLERARVAAD